MSKLIKTKFMKELFPNSKNIDEIVDSLNKILPEYNIDRPKRIAMFLAQTGHESGGFRVFEENLNYSAKALELLFSKYFKNKDTNYYARRPEKIANIIYSNRMGNGDELSGDGWKYRGRGAIQITGRHNYELLSRDCNIDAVIHPDMLLEVNNSILSAVWYWNKHDLNSYADLNDIKGSTRKINGGYNGLEDRITKYKKILKYLTSEDIDIIGLDLEEEFNNIHDINDDNNIDGVLRLGSTGNSVKVLQRILSLEITGNFDQEMEKFVKLWQRMHNLEADGIVGPKTLDSMNSLY